MKKNKKLGLVYEFCKCCDACPVAVEAKVGEKSGLEIKDDFGGSVKLTDDNLKDFKKFLDKRFGQK